MMVLKEVNRLQFLDMLIPLEQRAKSIKNDFHVEAISSTALRIYLNKKSIMTLEYIISEHPYILTTDYKGIKDILETDVQDTDEIIDYVADYLVQLNLIEKEIITL